MSARALVLVVAIAAVTVLSMGLGTLQAHPVIQAPSPAPSGGGSAPQAASASGSGLSDPQGPAIEQRVLATAKADHIPMAAVSLPNLLGAERLTNGVVSPLYTTAPAPMGIGTIGVLNTTGTSTPYQILTNSWEGTITLNSVNTFLLANDGALTAAGNDNTFGVQLNAVTVNTTVGNSPTYSFWAQNVVYWNLYPGYITFLDNIWNFSSPAVSLTSGTLYSYNGTPVYPDYYYDFGPSIAVTLPVAVHLYLNSSVTSLLNGYAYDTIRFGYDIVNPITHASVASGVYDTVLFNSTRAIGTVAPSPFQVLGSVVTPTGFLPYDAEIMIGGPGGGTTTSIYGISGSESLQYWNGTAYANPPSAWNIGTDTGETSEGIAETYTSPGTVQLTAGPSFPMPFWNESGPGGGNANQGIATFTGAISPSNAFIFFTQGRAFNTSFAEWAPTQTATSYAYYLPPGTYTIDAMLSDYKPIQSAPITVGAGGSHVLNLVLTRNTRYGVYTPLDAWNNGQLTTITISGSGTPTAPYTLDNNPSPSHAGLNPVFGEMNDYLYQVFPAVMLIGTTAHVDITGHANVFDVTYPYVYLGALLHYSLPLSNEQPIEIYDASNVAVWHLKGITGWFFFEDYGPTGLLPLANVVIYGGTHDLVGGSTFESQGSSLLLADIFAGLQDNVVWGNTFTNSAVLAPAMYPGDWFLAAVGPPIGIFAFESGDLIYNNLVATTIPAFEENVNFFTGSGQLNLENWNLSAPKPLAYKPVFDGEMLAGTIIPSAAQGGNAWLNFAPGFGLPYNDYGYIAAGGDFFPLPLFPVTFVLSGTGLPVTWNVTLSGATGVPVQFQQTSAASIVFFASNGYYTYSDATKVGTITPASGVVLVFYAPVLVPLVHS